MITLGNKARDRITGFEGIVVGKTVYINGCVSLLVRPRVDKDGKFPDGQWIDEPHLELIEGGIDVEPTIGGEQEQAPKR